MEPAMFWFTGRCPNQVTYIIQGRTYTELLKLNNKTHCFPIEATNLNRDCTKEGIWMANKLVEKWSKSFSLQTGIFQPQFHCNRNSRSVLVGMRNGSRFGRQFGGSLYNIPLPKDSATPLTPGYLQLPGVGSWVQREMLRGMEQLCSVLTRWAHDCISQSPKEWILLCEKVNWMSRDHTWKAECWQMNVLQNVSHNLKEGSGE